MMDILEKGMNRLVEEVTEAGKALFRQMEEKKKEESKELEKCWDMVTVLLEMIEVELAKEYLRNYFEDKLIMEEMYEEELLEKSRELQNYYISHSVFLAKHKGVSEGYDLFAECLEKKENEYLDENYLMDNKEFCKSLKEWKSALEKF